MSSPPQHRPPPPATVTPPPPANATQPQPLPRAFLATSAPQRAAAATPTPPPPLFTGRPLNPNPTHASPAAHGILYPVTTASYPAAAAAAAVANHRRIPQLSVGYPRAHAVAVPIAPSPQQPQAPTQPRSYAAVPRAVVAGVTPRLEQPPRGVPITVPQPHPKLIPVQAVTPTPQENSNAKERESTKEDTSTVVINDRKVNVLDSESGSLYALCRSWVRNGVPHEIQPSFVGNVAPLLPRPLPASVVDSRLSEKDNDAEDQDSEEEKNETGEYTAANLLKQHVTRAKKIRAKLRKERQVRIERYKQRLALLLPPPPPPPSEQ